MEAAKNLNKKSAAMQHFFKFLYLFTLIQCIICKGKYVSFHKL